MSNFSKRRGHSPGWKSGDHWVECQRTGQIARASDMREEWTGLIVHKDEWEPRHPQDFLRSFADHQAATGLVNPQGEPGFDNEDIEGNEVSVTPRAAIAGEAIAGVSIAGEQDTHGIDIPSGTFFEDSGTISKHTE